MATLVYSPSRVTVEGDTRKAYGFLVVEGNYTTGGIEIDPAELSQHQFTETSPIIHFDLANSGYSTFYHALYNDREAPNSDLLVLVVAATGVEVADAADVDGVNLSYVAIDLPPPED